MIEDDAALGPLLALFQSEVHDRADRVDPTNEQDWFSVTLGWAIAKGLTPESAHDFAIHVRYKTNLARPCRHLYDTVLGHRRSPAW